MTAEIDVDCTINCKLIDHGNLLTKSLTKRQMDENKLISFMVLKCQNFIKNLDENVRYSIYNNILTDVIIYYFILFHNFREGAHYM